MENPQIKLGFKKNPTPSSFENTLNPKPYNPTLRVRNCWTDLGEFFSRNAPQNKQF
jgi:hypothetical protein